MADFTLTFHNITKIGPCCICITKRTLCVFAPIIQSTKPSLAHLLCKPNTKLTHPRFYFTQVKPLVKLPTSPPYPSTPWLLPCHSPHPNTIITSTPFLPCHTQPLTHLSTTKLQTLTLFQQANCQNGLNQSFPPKVNWRPGLNVFIQWFITNLGSVQEPILRLYNEEGGHEEIVS